MEVHKEQAHIRRFYVTNKHLQKNTFSLSAIFKKNIHEYKYICI